MGSVYSSSREQFEQRMRARRVATCLAVARTAIASGRLSEAIERVEEACSLAPDAAEPKLLLEELRRQDEPVQEEVEPVPAFRAHHSEIAGWNHWLAAGVAICALAALAFFWPPSRPETGAGPSSAPLRQQEPSLPPPSAPAAAGMQPSTVPVPSVEPPAVGTAGGTPQSAIDGSGQPSTIARGDETSPGQPAAPPTAVTKALPIVPGSTPVPGTTPPAPASDMVASASQRPASPQVPSSPQPSPGTAAVQDTTDAPAGTAQPKSLAPPLPPVDSSTVMAEDLTRQVPSEAVSATPLAAPTTTTRTGDVADASLRAAVDPSDEIADTLRRYAEAYTRLDANAAHAVWPSVDERALARAFDGLASQRLVFEHCDVTIRGADATAACRGRAGYVPKVGSREPLVEQRQWSFRLRRADAGWQIVQADAR